jgi:hypothetical protein
VTTPLAVRLPSAYPRQHGLGMAFKWGMANRLVLRADGCSPMDLAKLSRARCADGDAETDANVTVRVDERLIPKPASSACTASTTRAGTRP